MHKIILKGLVGSRAYGMDTPESDYDYRGVFLAPPSEYLGLDYTDSIVSKDPDCQLHELKRFCNLALNANPSILELLYLPNYETLSTAGEVLISNRDKFLSRKVADSYGGYAIAQIKKCKQKLEDPSCKAGIKAKNPWKHAAHCIRLLYQGQQLLRGDGLTLQLGPFSKTIINDIRNGQTTPEAFYKYANELLEHLNKLKDFSPLPQYPDRDGINKVCQYILRNYLRDC